MGRVCMLWGVACLGIRPPALRMCCGRGAAGEKWGQEILWMGVNGGLQVFGPVILVAVRQHLAASGPPVAHKPSSKSCGRKLLQSWATCQWIPGAGCTMEHHVGSAPLALWVLACVWGVWRLWACRTVLHTKSYPQLQEGTAVRASARAAEGARMRANIFARTAAKHSKPAHIQNGRIRNGGISRNFV